jgi:hypothetical protein
VVLRHGTVHLDVATQETNPTDIVASMLGAYADGGSNQGS